MSSLALETDRTIPQQLEQLSRVESAVSIQLLTNRDQEEILAFLALRPFRTVFMVSFIRDNGMLSPLNRGNFYACRDAHGRLEGVALIGHAVLIEARTEAALQAFARLAHSCSRTYVMMGEQPTTERFCAYLAQMGHAPRMVCRELMLEQLEPATRLPAVQLRPAKISEVELIANVNATFIQETSGVNPLQKDSLGFRVRLGRRIEQGRVWVWINDDKLIFKAEIISDTPEVVYLEGIHVAQEERGKGYGLRCLTQLGQNLLVRTGAICLLVDEQNIKAQTFYRRAGYQLRSHYDTVYL